MESERNGVVGQDFWEMRRKAQRYNQKQRRKMIGEKSEKKKTENEEKEKKKIAKRE